MAYQMQVKIDNKGKKIWASVCPTGQEPYTFATYDEAEDCLRMCYPCLIMGEEVQIIKVDAPVNINWTTGRRKPFTVLEK